jgi:hypothetical protein
MIVMYTLFFGGGHGGDPMFSQLQQFMLRHGDRGHVVFQLPNGGNRHNLPHRERDFTSGNSYEQLLALDKNNVKVVMSKNDVENMPCTTFNSNMKLVDPTCSICLLDYEEGDQIRTITCFHQFHQACIDRWLTQEKKVCPVCQSSL